MSSIACNECMIYRLNAKKEESMACNASYVIQIRYRASHFVRATPVALHAKKAESMATHALHVMQIRYRASHFINATPVALHAINAVSTSTHAIKKRFVESMSTYAIKNDSLNLCRCTYPKTIRWISLKECNQNNSLNLCQYMHLKTIR